VPAPVTGVNLKETQANLATSVVHPAVPVKRWSLTVYGSFHGSNCEKDSLGKAAAE
jgi:hypothetical protein